MSVSSLVKFDSVVVIEFVVVVLCVSSSSSSSLLRLLVLLLSSSCSLLLLPPLLPLGAEAPLSTTGRCSSYVLLGGSSLEEETGVEQDTVVPSSSTL